MRAVNLSIWRGHVKRFGISIFAAWILSISGIAGGMPIWVTTLTFGVLMPTAAIVAGAILPRIKIRNFLLSVLVSTGLVCLIFGGTFSACIWLCISAAAWGTPQSDAAFQIFKSVSGRTSFQISLLATIAVVFVLSAVAKVSRKLGPGILWNWITGKYHQPREETRFFMFLDINDSTELAERLGNLRFSAMVRDFFADLTGPCIETNAEVSHYIGDEAVISWVVENGAKNGNCIRFFELFRQAVDGAADRYRARYGVVPGFKAGLHFGTVVTTEVGDLKSEIVFHGDVMNTASRLQGLCSALGYDLLISEAALRACKSVEGLATDDLLEQVVKGRSVPVHLFGLVSTKQQLSES